MSAPEFFMSLCAHQPAVLDVFDSLLQARVARVQEEAQGGEGTDNSQVITKTEAGKAGGAGSGTDPGLAMFSQAHWSQQAIEEGLAAGSLLQGVVHVSARSRQEGVVVVGAGPSGTSGSMLGRLLRLSGLAAINRAMHGDRVAGGKLGLVPGGLAMHRAKPACLCHALLTCNACDELASIGIYDSYSCRPVFIAITVVGVSHAVQCGCWSQLEVPHPPHPRWGALKLGRVIMKMREVAVMRGSCCWVIRGLMGRRRGRRRCWPQVGEFVRGGWDWRETAIGIADVSLPMGIERVPDLFSLAGHGFNRLHHIT
jgi:hypothetical protein